MWVTVEADGSRPISRRAAHHHGIAGCERQVLADPHPPRRPNQCLPLHRCQLTQEQDLHLSPTSARATEACRDHSAVVDNQQVAGSQPVPQLAKRSVLECGRAGPGPLAIEEEEARGVPGLDGDLGNRRFRQGIVEVVHAQPG